MNCVYAEYCMFGNKLLFVPDCRKLNEISSRCRVRVIAKVTIRSGFPVTVPIVEGQSRENYDELRFRPGRPFVPFFCAVSRVS